MLENCQFPSKETALMIPGSAGNLEAIIVGPENSAAIKAVAIVCHPHPLFSGTMKNKVVTTVANTLKQLGLGVIRFNFRGVGKSEGKYGETVGESEDLLAVIAWVKKYCPDRSLWLAGFSFGAFIAAKVATQQKIEKLILIAPPVNHFDFANLPPLKVATYVAQGDLDEVVPAKEVAAWASSLKNPHELIIFPTATHFFHGHLSVLRDKLLDKLK